MRTQECALFRPIQPSSPMTWSTTALPVLTRPIRQSPTPSIGAAPNTARTRWRNWLRWHQLRGDGVFCPPIPPRIGSRRYSNTASTAPPCPCSPCHLRCRCPESLRLTRCSFWIYQTLHPPLQAPLHYRRLPTGRSCGCPWESLLIALQSRPPPSIKLFPWRWTLSRPFRFIVSQFVNARDSHAGSRQHGQGTDRCRSSLTGSRLEHAWANSQIHAVQSREGARPGNGEIRVKTRAGPA